MYDYVWRGTFENGEVNSLHAEGFGDQLVSVDWRSQLARHSLGWVCARKVCARKVCAREAAQLVGFVNVAWDGGVHAFVLDTLVSAQVRRQGVGTGLLAVAVDNARAAGCEWLHVDFEEHLRPFYLDTGPFTATPAGVVAL